MLAQSSGIFRTWSKLSCLRGGRGKTLDAMHEFHKRHRIQAHTGKGRRDKNGRDYIRWCFANPGITQKFAMRKPVDNQLK